MTVGSFDASPVTDRSDERLTDRQLDERLQAQADQQRLDPGVPDPHRRRTPGRVRTKKSHSSAMLVETMHTGELSS